MVTSRKTSRVDRDGKDGAGWYIPNVVSRSLAWRSMTLGEFRLITDAASLFNLSNNGHIAMSFSYMRKHFCWSSSDTLNSAKEGLIRKGLLVKTRQGDANQTPDLFVLTWLSLNRGNDKLDIDPIVWNKTHRGAYARWTPELTPKKTMPKPAPIKLISRVRPSDRLRLNIVRPSDRSI